MSRPYPGADPLRGVAELLLDRKTIARRISELGAELSAHNGERPPVLVGVLKGSTMFLADLVRAMGDVSVDFMSISAYEGGLPGVVRIVKDLETDVVGRDVVIVEDIVDTGLTLTYLRRSLGERSPRSLRTVTLLDKTARRIVPVQLEHRGFEIPDVFVVGFGLDFQGLYRNLPDVYAVHDLPRLLNTPDLLVPALYTRSQAGQAEPEC
jgi:hypoxanthine phosphoribosyltransferase